jgi:transposase
VSRLLSELGHETIVAHARSVRLIGESRRKDDRIDAMTLARLVRIDPQLLCGSAGDQGASRSGPYTNDAGQRNSGQSEPQMHISKEGDPYLRSLLVQAAHHVLGPWGVDSDLRRWGTKLAEHGGKRGRNAP